MCVCVCVCVRACARACTRARARVPDQQLHCEVNVRSEAKCLGYWWRNDLLASTYISVNIGRLDVPFSPWKYWCL